MPRIVQFMTDGQQRPSLGARASGGVFRVARAGGEKIPIRLLGFGDDLDEAVDVFLQLEVRMLPERIRSALNHLVDIGVVVSLAFVCPSLEACGDPEVVHPPGLLVHAEGERDGNRAVGFDAGGPELVLDLHLRERNRHVGVIDELHLSADDENGRKNHADVPYRLYGRYRQSTCVS